MKLSEIFRRQGATDQSFDKLESSLSEMLLVEMTPPEEPDESPTEDGGLAVVVERGVEEEADDLLPVVAEADASDELDEVFEMEAVPPLEAQPDPVARTSAYTQARLAEFTAFESLQHELQDDLELVTGALAKIRSAQHQTREFLNGVHSSIHRANELETSVGKITAENRLLYGQAEHVNRLRGRHEALVEAYKHREAKLLENTEALRTALAAVKMELVEAQSAIASLEAGRQETMNALVASNSQAERASRENEVLREKHINLAADLEAVSRKRTEAERRTDELSAIHARDTAEIAEIRAKTSSAEAERQRLQKQNDALQSRMTELTEALAALETEMEEQAKRHDLGLKSLKSERDTLSARLEVLTRAEIEAAEHTGGLNDRLHEAIAERRILEERVAALLRERDEDAARRRDTAELEQENKRLEALVQALSAAEPARPANGQRHAAPANSSKRNGAAAPGGALPASDLVVGDQSSSTR